MTYPKAVQNKSEIGRSCTFGKSLVSMFRLTLVVMAAFVFAGCAYFQTPPSPTTLEQRLESLPTKGLPLKGRTVIYWDKYQIPFIDAEHDEDAAMALGLVHAHLRLGHMELARLASQGRMSEVLGPVSVNVDHAVRIFDFARAVPEMEAALSKDTSRWLEAFITGVNHYIANAKEMPHEFQVLGIDRKPWTVRDLLTFSRIAGSDANWSVWMTLLKLRERDDWPQIWAQLLETGSGAHTTFDGMEGDDLNEMLSGFSHTGSNAIAISGKKSSTGTALFSADPHVAYVAPTIWMLAGVKSPSYHVVGIMPTGMPYFALGRNPSAAWGGTNLYAASSSFLDVSAVEDKDITVRRETIKVRSLEPVEIKIRETKWGPIISDLPQLSEFNLPDTALRWVGHLPSDETGAMLAANRATSFAQFRAAFANYAASGMNMVYADASGNVGQVQAVRLPRRKKDKPSDILRKPAEVEPYWQSFVDATTLPALQNPPLGYVATANNKPPEGEVPVGIFFSTNDRIDRINELLRNKRRVDVQYLKSMHKDVYMASSVKVRDAFIAKAAEIGLNARVTEQERQTIKLIADWDGHYRADSRGALAYELFRRGYGNAYYRPIFGPGRFTNLTDVTGGDFKILNDLSGPDQKKVARALRQAVAYATNRLETRKNWGSVHRLRLVHPLAVLPIVGERYRFGDYPIGGSTQTLMKSGHNQGGKDFIPYHGATARFIADLSDLDTNYFVLVGGQDGWLNSSTFLDQTPLFLSGKYIQLPLRLEAARARAVKIHQLK